MYTKQVTIHNPSGLHARPASEFVAAAAKFKSRITIRKDEDETVAVDSLVALIEGGFGE